MLFLRVLLFCLRDLLAYLYATYIRASWAARGVQIARSVIVRAHKRDSIVLGFQVKIAPGCLLIVSDERTAPGASSSKLTIGGNTVVNEYCNLRAAGGRIHIGSNCLFAQMITIVASNHSTELGVNIADQPWSGKSASVLIGDDVWVGANVVILPGSIIESGAIIAAGAVVRGLVPANEIWGGIPAKKISQRNRIGLSI